MIKLKHPEFGHVIFDGMTGRQEDMLNILKNQQDLTDRVVKGFKKAKVKVKKD